MLSIIQKLLFAFVTLILGLVLIGTIATSTGTTTSLVGISNEGIDITPALNTATDVQVNFTHGTTFSDATGSRGTYLFPTISEALFANGTRNLACTEPIIHNQSTGDVIPSPANWAWATEAQAKGRCGIVFNASSFPQPAFNESKWNFTYTATWKTVVNTVPLSIAHVPTGWKAESCPIATIVLTNGTTVLTQGTDYTYSLGRINLISSLGNNGSTTYSYKTNYNYCPDNYISGWGGTVLNLIPGFFALALLLFSVGMFYSVAKEVGIL